MSCRPRCHSHGTVAVSLSRVQLCINPFRTPSSRSFHGPPHDPTNTCSRRDKQISGQPNGNMASANSTLHSCAPTLLCSQIVFSLSQSLMPSPLLLLCSTPAQRHGTPQRVCSLRGLWPLRAPKCFQTSRATACRSACSDLRRVPECPPGAAGDSGSAEQPGGPMSFLQQAVQIRAHQAHSDLNLWPEKGSGAAMAKAIPTLLEGVQPTWYFVLQIDLRWGTCVGTTAAN